MKEFNLEEAKAGKPVCTRDGRKARIICYDVKNKFSIVAVVTDKDNCEDVYQYKDNGKYDTEISNLDLMMKSEKHVGWTNIYRGDFGSGCFRTVGIYKSKELAVGYKSCSGYIATIKVEWED